MYLFISHLFSLSFCQTKLLINEDKTMDIYVTNKIKGYYLKDLLGIIGRNASCGTKILISTLQVSDYKSQ